MKETDFHYPREGERMHWIVRGILFVVGYSWLIGLGALWLEPARWPVEIQFPVVVTLMAVGFGGYLWVAKE